MSNDQQKQTYRRMGDTAKCPACGWSMDPQAYRCPKCRIYFCYKCRARVAERDEQFQCADQSCECYGKLLCSACTVMVPEYGNVTRTIPGREKVLYGRVTVAVVIAVGSIVGGIWFWGFGGVFLLGILLIGGLLLRISDAFPTLRNKLFIKKRPDKIKTREEQVANHRCCIQCRHPVKHL